MTIEVRQLLIRAVVGEDAPPHAHGPSHAAVGPLRSHELERLRAQLLAECRAMLAEQLRQREER
jgi:hypothetical protein